ncbi:hypothetical protein HGRIS_006463 [Hohenbuehelia grisea]|uniref:Pyridoxamine 5'-phosphate oxidase N-terminal domain-containing protein n=1 Tax=Hohenbuehelia grisea TaxID=104357 RepID=A0ABR3K0X8_9AGAR
MGETFDAIPDRFVAWILKQHVFWVATAPLTADGHVNVSPKGIEGSFRIVNANKVWYEDLSGSGNETIAHLRENGRITILFNAFEGPPRIVRMLGKGTYHEYGTPEYDEYLPAELRTPGSRGVVVINVHRVGSSCGYAVPFYEYKAHRTKLVDMSVKMECIDRDAETSAEGPFDTPPRPAGGLKAYWNDINHFSIDGLPGQVESIQSTKVFPVPGPASLTKFKSTTGGDKSDLQMSKPRGHVGALSSWKGDARSMLALGFSAGFLAAAVSMKLMNGF